MTDHPDEKAPREPAEHTAGRFVGILVFLAGIALLVLTFNIAYQAFHQPDILLPLRYLQSPKVSPTFIYMRAALLLVLLFVMGYVASLIAARGAQLFFSARKEM
jgi:hypothetical protein